MMAYDLFRIDIDRPQTLAQVMVRGFWDDEVGRRFATAYADAIKTENWGSAYFCLIDMQDFPVQSQALIVTFFDLGANPALKARRMAMVSDSMLQRMQAERITQPHVEDRRNIDNFEDAWAWLLAP